MESKNHLKFYAILNIIDYVEKSYVIAFVINDFTRGCVFIMRIEAKCGHETSQHYPQFMLVVGAAVINVTIVLNHHGRQQCGGVL